MVCPPLDTTYIGFTTLIDFILTEVSERDFFLKVKVQKSSTSQKSWRIMSFVHTTIGGCIELESNIFVFGAIHSVSFIQHLFTHKLHYNKSTAHNKVNMSKFSRALNIEII